MGRGRCANFRFGSLEDYLTAVTVWYAEGAIIALKFETSGTELIARNMTDNLLIRDNTLTVGNTPDEGVFHV